MLVPAAFGIGLCNATLIALVSNAASRREQGRVQGAAGALESLGRTLGPVWGNAVLQRIGEGAAYGAAAGLLLIAAGMAGRYNRAGPRTREQTEVAVRSGGSPVTGLRRAPFPGE